MLKVKYIYIKKYFLFISFSIFILILSLLNFISKDKEFSYMENRYLQTKPKFTLKKFIDNNFSNQYELFINDQFILRDSWITLKMIFEMLLMKVENHNVIIGKDNYLFDKFISFNMSKVNENLNSIISTIKKNKSKKIFFTLIPNSYEILKDKLPLGLNNIDQIKNINNIYDKLLSNNLYNLDVIDSAKILKNKTDKVYYCTDHHWTTLGAYYFYYELSKIFHYDPVNLSLLKKNKVTNFYGTYYSRAKILWKKPDNIFYYDISINSINVDNKIYNNLYNIKKFDLKDKYSGFLYGNNGLTIIDCKKSKYKKDNILIIKDSYANSLIPFLTYHYNQIYVIDLRYIKKSDVEKFLKVYNIDVILIIYNFINFVADNNIFKIEYL